MGTCMGPAAVTPVGSSIVMAVGGVESSAVGTVAPAGALLGAIVEKAGGTVFGAAAGATGAARGVGGGVGLGTAVGCLGGRLVGNLLRTVTQRPAHI